MGTSSITTVEFPSGVRPTTLHGHAGSWDAWDALTASDGWEEQTWKVEPDELGHPASLHTQKVGEIRGHRITVFPPQQPQPCGACGGEGGRVSFTPGSKMPDPQTAETCDRCEGFGREIPVTLEEDEAWGLAF